MIRCNQIAMFLDVKLPFNLIVTAKTSTPEQFERPHFESHVEGLGAQHDVTAHKKREFQEDNITKCKMVRVVAVQTERPEILKEGYVFIDCP